MTFSESFWFWISKFLAEAAMALTIILGFFALAIIYGLIRALLRKNRK